VQMASNRMRSGWADIGRVTWDGSVILPPSEQN
jgi:hypothetical protein